MIDLHSHVLPGLDDGAADLDAALEMARAMAESGVRVVCATPHVRDDFPTSPGSMERALELVQAAVAEAGIAIEVRGGAEIALDRLPRLDSGMRARFGLGGNPGLVLLEMPYATWPTDLPRVCARLREDGIVPVVAHPERNPRRPERADAARRRGRCRRGGAGDRGVVRRVGSGGSPPGVRTGCSSWSSCI